MSFDAELDLPHAIPRVIDCRETDQRKLYWRGWAFYGSLTHVGTYRCDRVTRRGAPYFDAHRPGWQLNIPDWVLWCVNYAATHGVGPFVVLAPYEIHLIEDPEAYVAALDAYLLAIKSPG